jgi:hypothetical protein
LDVGGFAFIPKQALRARGHHSTAHQTLDEEKSKHAGLAQQNHIGPAFFLHMMLMLAKGVQSLRPAVDWFDGFIGLGWFLIASNGVPPFAVPISIL